MAATFELDQFPGLPLWGQVYVASRMVRRAALAMLAGPALAAAERVCDEIDGCAREGRWVGRDQRSNEQVAALGVEAGFGDGGAAGGVEVVQEALWWLVDAARAAEASQDFAIDGTVTRSARAAMSVIAADERVTRLQMAILLAGDLDQVRFTTREAGVGKYDALTGYVFERITPVHALDLADVKRGAQDDDERDEDRVR